MNHLGMFNQGLSYVVGDGRQIKFWEDMWCGERSLKEDFLEVYTLAMDQNSNVATCFSVQGEETVWQPILRRAVF